MADEQVRFDIKVDVENAVQQLKKIADSSETGVEAVKRLSMFLLKMSKETKIPLEQLRRTLQGINNELVRNTGTGLFSNFTAGNQGIFAAEKAYTAAAHAGQRFQMSHEGVVTSINRGNKAFDQADKAARGYGHGIDVVRTALGTLVAVGIFQFLNSISQAFTTMIHNLREAELAIYNLTNAEKRLSEQGIEVTPKGLQETIDSVRALVPILSQIQAEELVSRIATNVAPALKLTNEQIKQMAEATALLYVRNKALGKSFDEVESQLTNAFLTGKVSQGINQLGVKISDQIVRDEALRMGLVKTAEEFDKLSGEAEAHVKSVAMLSVVYKNATQDIGSLGEYMETTDASIESTKTAWNDLLTQIGVLVGPLVGKVLRTLADSMLGWQKIFEATKPIMVDFFSTWVGFIGAIQANIKGGLGMSTREFIDTFAQLKQAAVDKAFMDFGDAADTATSAIEDTGDAIEDLKADEFKNKIDDILQDAENARQDLETKLGQKRADIDTEYLRKAADAQKDYQRKVEDIERDYLRDLQKLRDKQRDEDLREEEKYQLKLWELRMRFLMDLEDALHARDARQVIRLQKQYELDKELLARKQALDDKQREEDQRNEREDIEIKRQQRLEDAKTEYDQRLADQRLAKQRELDDLAVWYKREQRDIQTNIQRKLEALIAGWVAEKKITAENAAQVYQILAQYFGPGGLTDQLYAYMASKLATPIPMPIPMFGSIGSRIISQDTRTPTAPTPTGTRSGRKMAEGGTLIATRPTTVTFGEAGAEMASFTPLGRIGRNTGKVFSSGDTAGLNGQITVSLNLSPDLEARVVENSINGVAEVVAKINRSKL